MSRQSDDLNRRWSPADEDRVEPVAPVSRPDTRPLYRKFDVRRMDGTDAIGEKHHDCTYFVLDLQHDPHAVPALTAYADSCAIERPALAADLRSIVDFWPTSLVAMRPHCDLQPAAAVAPVAPARPDEDQLLKHLREKHCLPEPHLSRTCELGTNCCPVHHFRKVAEAVAPAPEPEFTRELLLMTINLGHRLHGESPTESLLRWQHDSVEVQSLREALETTKAQRAVEREALSAAVHAHDELEKEVEELDAELVAERLAHAQTRTELEDWVEREAACCPEDFGFEEVIASQRKQISDLLAALAAAGAATPKYAALKQAAAEVVRQFQFLQQVQYKELVKGQTLESASKNWEGLGNEYIEFQPLIDALAAWGAPEDPR